LRGDAEKFLDCLQDAGQLLEDYPAVTHTGAGRALGHEQAEHFDLALFEKWSEFFDADFQQKSPIRIIQHLSCTGGSLICKCLAGLPNVALLSEVNPLSELHVDSTPPGFAPTDLIFLSKRGGLPLINELSENIFKAEIEVIAKHARQFGKHLVIREHSHSDFLMDSAPNESSTIRRLIKKDHPVISVLTVRHPVDSYLSMATLGWHSFSPNTFEEYCRRYTLFIEHNKDVPVFKYEDFISDPLNEMKRLCKSLQLPFNDDFLDIFDINPMSGDSGRTSHIIEKRERRKFDDKFQKELDESVNYKALCDALGYVTTLDADSQQS